MSDCDRCKAAIKSSQSAEVTADGVDPLAEALIAVEKASTGSFQLSELRILVICGQWTVAGRLASHGLRDHGS